VNIGLYIDAQNLWYGASDIVRDSGGGKFGIDYPGLINEVVDGRDMAVAKAYIIHHHGRASESLEKRLTAMGIDCYSKYNRSRGDSVAVDGMPTTNWNTNIVIDASEEKSQWDVLCLVASNSAFLPLIQAVLEQGKQVELCGFKQRMEWAARLAKIANSEFSLRFIPESLIIRGA